MHWFAYNIHWCQIKLQSPHSFNNNFLFKHKLSTLNNKIDIMAFIDHFQSNGKHDQNSASKMCFLLWFCYMLHWISSIIRLMIGIIIWILFSKEFCMSTWRFYLFISLNNSWPKSIEFFLFFSIFEWFSTNHRYCDYYYYYCLASYPKDIPR